MRATSGIFKSRAEAERAAWKLQSGALHSDRIILLIPGDIGKQMQGIPLSSEEGPGVGMALGVVMGVALGLAGGFESGPIVGSQVPGAVTAVTLWGAVIFLGLAGAAAGAALGSALDDATTDGLPRDELAVYQEALRNGLSIVLAFTEDGNTAKFFRRLLAAGGAESIDKARKDWWIGQRSAPRALMEGDAGGAGWPGK
jgi:hypothetical protein